MTEKFSSHHFANYVQLVADPLCQYPSDALWRDLSDFISECDLTHGFQKQIAYVPFMEAI